jgi:hypothetical protein
MKKTKIFDCVEMKREAQEKIYEEIKNMSMDDEIKYWKRIHEMNVMEFKNFKTVPRKSRI